MTTGNATSLDTPLAPPRHWRAAGWVVRTAGGKCARAFEALVPIRCRNCARTIAPGERFSRVRLTTRAQVRYPFCRTCLPFTEAADERVQGRYSTMV